MYFDLYIKTARAKTSQMLRNRKFKLFANLKPYFLY